MSRSNAAHASTPSAITLTTAKRGRGRPRKTARQPPLPAVTILSRKRQKLRHPIGLSQDDIFAIKDIIGEKLVDDKRFFRIDWEDNPASGHSFEPTWEPEENVNDQAIEDWERGKQHKVLPEEPSDLLSNQSLALEPWSPSPQPHSISIALLSRSDFLRLRPDFNTASVIAISSSQLSDFDSESDLPPSQFWVPSSQPSQDIIAGSQPAFTSSPAQKEVVPPTKAGSGISQTTIPDSQDYYSNELSQNIVEVPGTIEDLRKSGSARPNGSHRGSSGSTIPSHQPDINQISFEDESLAVNLEHYSLSQHKAHQHHPSASCLPAALDGQGDQPNLSGGFFTQPAFDSGEFIISADSGSKSQPQSQSQARVTVNIQSTSVEDTTQLESHQPAQFVSPLRDRRSQSLLTHPDFEFFSATEDYEVVPDSSLQRSGPSKPHGTARSDRLV